MRKADYPRWDLRIRRFGYPPEWIPEPIPRYQGMILPADMVWFPSYPLDICTHICTYYILLYTHIFHFIWPLRLVESYFPNQGMEPVPAVEA